MSFLQNRFDLHFVLKVIEQTYLTLSLSDEEEVFWRCSYLNDDVIRSLKLWSDTLNDSLNDVKFIFEHRILHKSIDEDLAHNFILQTRR